MRGVTWTCFPGVGVYSKGEKMGRGGDTCTWDKGVRGMKRSIWDRGYGERVCKGGKGISVGNTEGGTM